MESVEWRSDSQGGVSRRDSYSKNGLGDVDRPTDKFREDVIAIIYSETYSQALFTTLQAFPGTEARYA